MLWAKGANGKTVFTSTLQEAQAISVTVTPFSTFGIAAAGGIPNDVMRCARLGWCSRVRVMLASRWTRRC